MNDIPTKQYLKRLVECHVETRLIPYVLSDHDRVFVRDGRGELRSVVAASNRRVDERTVTVVTMSDGISSWELTCYGFAPVLLIEAQGVDG